MQQQQRQMPTSLLLKRFIPYFYKYRKLLVIVLMSAGRTTVCEPVQRRIGKPEKRGVGKSGKFRWPQYI